MPKRVYEVAKEHGVVSKDVLRALAGEGIFVRSASSTLTPDQLDTLNALFTETSSDAPMVTAGPDNTPAPPAVDFSKATLRNLIRMAFEAARRNGKDNWQYMTTAVLKNRLGQVSNSKFDQRAYGYRNMVELVLDFPDLLIVDERESPAVVRLIDHDGPPLLDETARVRPDLWRAIIDFESHTPYIWDGERAYREDEAAAPATPIATVPTITPDILAEWRRRFIESEASVILKDEPDLLVRVLEWAGGRRGTRALPGILQGRWNLFQKTAVVNRLRSWFQDSGLAIPPDIIQKHDIRDPELVQAASQEAQLRSALLDVISRLSFTELQAVSLPASALLRMQQS